MKDISIYFGSFGEKDSSITNTIGEKIIVNSRSNFSLPEENDIALIFVPEYRNSNLTINKEDIETLRKNFYSLYAGNWSSNLYDLGTIEPGNSYEDTQKALSDVVAELVKAEVFPIIIGGSQDLTYSIYKGYEKLEQTINILDVDCSIDLGDPEDDISDKSWLNKIILHKPGYLFNYSLLGYQGYLSNPEELHLLDKMYFDAFRLGDFYSNNQMVEPLVRHADILSFDLNAIRSSDYHGNSRFLPHGFYGEDACRIMRYAGLSDKLTSLGLFNFNAKGGSVAYDSNLISQMIWYFVDGFNQRKRDYPIASKSSYLKYRVNLDDFKNEIVFYKSDKSSRWWMEVPYPRIKGVKFQRHLMVPCTYQDYEKAQQNEMPNLWWRTFKKLS